MHALELTESLQGFRRRQDCLPCWWFATSWAGRWSPAGRPLRRRISCLCIRRSGAWQARAVGGSEATDIELSSPKDVTPGTVPPWDNSSFGVWGGVVASWGCETPGSSRTARGQHPHLRKAMHYANEAYHFTLLRSYCQRK